MQTFSQLIAENCDAIRGDNAERQIQAFINLYALGRDLDSFIDSGNDSIDWVSMVTYDEQSMEDPGAWEELRRAVREQELDKIARGVKVDPSHAN